MSSNNPIRFGFSRFWLEFAYFTDYDEMMRRLTQGSVGTNFVELWPLLLGTGPRTFCRNWHSDIDGSARSLPAASDPDPS